MGLFLEDGAGRVADACRVLSCESAYFFAEGFDLSGCHACVSCVGVVDVLDFIAAEHETVIGAEAVEQVVAGYFACTQVVGYGNGVFFDNLMGCLTTNSAFDCCHHDGGGHKEGKVAVELALDDGLVDAHLVEDGDKGFHDAVSSEEGVGQGAAAYDGAAYIAFVPLVTDDASDHVEVSLEDRVEAVDALAGARIHLVGHGAGACLTLGKAFGAEFVPDHEAPCLAEAAGARGDADETGDDFKVEGAGVDLTDVVPFVGDAEVGADAVLKLGDGLGILPKEGELIELGAYGSFESAHAVAIHGANPRVAPVQQLLAKHGDALAHGAGLCGNIVGACGKDELLPLCGAGRHAVESCDIFVTDELHGAPDLELFDVFCQVTARHAFVNVLKACELAELINACFDIVARDALAVVDRVHVYLILNGFVGVNGFLRDVETEVFLGLHHGDPKLALQHDAAFCGPNIFHGGGCVASGEYIRNSVHNQFVYVV